MKQRAREAAALIQRLRARLAGLPGGVHCEARQLYHDREEITVFIAAPGAR
jgi:23S rRNA C2498 (ribose-2'-O)-methylase RlmM